MSRIKLVGYGRYDTPAALAALNDLYAHELGLLQNLFLPSVKHVRKERVGARLRRRYDCPQTPLARVRACPDADPAAVTRLLALRARLDPFALAATVDRKIDALLDLAARPARTLLPADVPAPPRRAARRDFTFANHLRRPSPGRVSVTS